MKRIYKIFILGCLALMASEVKAQDKKDLFNPVNYAVISQTIAPDARGGGLGDIGAATDPDVNSQYWNPAKYPFTIRVPVCRSASLLGCVRWSMI